MKGTQTALITVKKFSYLKELVIPKVRAPIDGPPFNTEGYERAKSILKAKFEKLSELANARIQCIMSLPTIAKTSIGKIYDFHEKLVTHSQTLDNAWLC